MGSYHGEHGFRAFSHERAVLRQGWPALVRGFFPPYEGWLPRLTRRVLRMRG
jgi:aldehyde dehydrogenase (NAD+)